MNRTLKDWTLRNWITIGLLGAVWGGVELTLGSILHMIFPPLADTFLTGVLLSAIGVILALAGKVLVENRGTVLFISIIAALLKLLSFGGVKVGPFLAILIQGVLMELCFLPRNRLRPVQFMAAGLSAVSWNLFHRFIMLRLLYGRRVLQVAAATARSGSEFFGIGEERILIILGLFFLIRAVVGLAAGLAGRGIGITLKERFNQNENG